MKTFLGALFTTTCALSLGYSDGFAQIEYLPQSEQLTSAEYAELVNPVQLDCQHLSQADQDYLDEPGILAGKGEFPIGDPAGAQLGTSSEMLEVDPTNTDGQPTTPVPTPSTGKSYFPADESTGTDSSPDTSRIPVPEVSGKRQAPMQPADPSSKGGVFQTPEATTTPVPMSPQRAK
jgi:hypothetical protein